VNKLNVQTSNLVLFFIAAFAAVFFGLVSLVLTQLVGERYFYLLALPLAIVIGFIFLFNRILFLSIVVILRSSLDVVFESIKIGSFGLGAVLNALIILIAILMFLDRDIKIDQSLTRPVKAWFLFISLNLVSLIYTPAFMTGLKGNLSYIAYASMFIIGLCLVKSERDFKKWVILIALSSLVPAIYGIFSLIFSMGGLRYSIGEGLRLQSTFPHPNPFAPYLVFMILICFYIWKDQSFRLSNSVKNILPVYILLLIGLLFMTKTRSAWAACYLMFLAYGLKWDKRILVFVIAAPFFAMFIPEIQERIVDLTINTEYGASGYGKLNSYAWRKKIWHDSIAWMTPAHYLAGYGIHAFVHHSMDFGWANAFQKADYEINAHNIYVQTFFNLGVIGLSAFLFLFYTCIKALKELYIVNKFLVFITLFSFFQLIMQGYSDNIWDYLVYQSYFWLFMGLSLSYLSYQKKV